MLRVVIGATCGCAEHRLLGKCARLGQLGASLWVVEGVPRVHLKGGWRRGAALQMLRWLMTEERVVQHLGRV
jgi:hypothetical protein